MAVHEVQQHSGVERAAAGAHHQAVHGGEAHRRGHASPCLHSARHARAVAEVRARRSVQLPPGRRCRGSTEAMYSYEMPWKPYRQTPSAVKRRGSANWPGRPRAGCGERPCRSKRPAATPAPLGHRPDCRQVVRLVQRRQRYKGLQRGQRRRPRPAPAAVNVRPPCPTRWPAATKRCPLRTPLRPQPKRKSIAPSCPEPRTAGPFLLGD